MAEAEGRDCTCLLLHVAHAGMTPALKALLEEPSLLKAGVNITGDATKLQADFGWVLGRCWALFLFTPFWY